MHDPSIAAAFDANGPWISRFTIDGVAYGGAFDGVNDWRLLEFRRFFPDARTILELGSLEGGQTIGLGQQPGVERVLGIEGRRQNLARARLAARLMKSVNVEFAEANLETAGLQQFGAFDAIYCCGLLYHLPEPWKLLDQFSAISPHLFLWTHYCHDEEADTTIAGYCGKRQGEGGLDEPLSGLSSHSFWPTLGSLLKMLTTAGFATVHIIINEIAQAEGPAVALAASTLDRNARPRNW